MPTSRIICLDTHVLIWGIKEDASPGQENLVEKAKMFLDSASENGDLILVPSVVVGEMLMPVPVEVHAMTLNLIRRGFMTAPYDLEAAAIFARLWQERRNDGAIDELLVEPGMSRSEMKADCQIVATALAVGAACIISHDSGVKKFAGSEIPVRELPAGVEQLVLLDEADGEVVDPDDGLGETESANDA